MSKLINEIVGVIPAAGHASRISPLPGSKELFPIGFYGESDESRPKVVGQYLLEQMENADIKRCFIVLGEGKWDIPAYFGNGETVGIDLAYSVIKKSKGTPFTVDAVFPFVADKIIALGFPDMLFSSEDVYRRLTDYYASTKCDVLLGLFPAAKPHLADMVAFDDKGVVNYINIKPKHTELLFTWGVALWNPAFSKYMHDWLANIDFSNIHNLGARHKHGELFIGDVIQAGLEAGLRVEAVHVSDKPFLDIGTPENLKQAVRKHALEI